jgi:hypothetical protein
MNSLELCCAVALYQLLQECSEMLPTSQMLSLSRRLLYILMLRLHGRTSILEGTTFYRKTACLSTLI